MYPVLYSYNGGIYERMRVILIDDVYNQGVAGEVVDVADGYARNYLLPQGFAVKATPGALKQAEKLRKDAKARRARIYNELQSMAEQVEGVELFFPMKAGTTGKLYGSVTMGDIAEALQEKLGFEFDKRRIGEGRSLRELGEHTVKVRLASDLTPAIKAIIHREGESPEETLEEMAALEETDIVEETPSEEEGTVEEQPA